MSLKQSWKVLLRVQLLERPVSRQFSSGSEEELREHAAKVADTLDAGKTKNVKRSLLERLSTISKESYMEATSAQYDELLAVAPKVVHEVPIIPSKKSMLRKSMDASEAVRKEAFQILRNRGYSSQEAHKRVEKIYQRLVDTFNKKQAAMVEDVKAKQTPMQALSEKSEHDLRQHILKEMQRLFDEEYDSANADNDEYYDFEVYQQQKLRNFAKHQQRPQAAKPQRSFDMASNATSFFNQSTNRLNIFDMDTLKSHNLEFWRRLEDEKTQIVNQGMGPRNAFEEQIEWTRQGKMWPYPINNEYMLGKESEVSFVEHVFLEPYWKKHNVPKSKAVEQFMELVLIGLSKNPYMSIEKKHEHIDWFANYFKEVIAGKYKSVL